MYLAYVPSRILGSHFQQAFAAHNDMKAVDKFCGELKSHELNYTFLEC